MPIVRPVLKDDITKLEADIFNGYRDGDHVFYISAIESKGDIQFVDDEVRASWSPNWTQANAVFESKLDSDPTFIPNKNKIFFIWDGNHRFFAWKNYIDRMHTEDFECHVFMDSILLASQHDDIPSLLTAMHNINK